MAALRAATKIGMLDLCLAADGVVDAIASGDSYRTPPSSSSSSASWLGSLGSDGILPRFLDGERLVIPGIAVSAQPVAVKVKARNIASGAQVPSYTCIRNHLVVIVIVDRVVNGRCSKLKSECHYSIILDLYTMNKSNCNFCESYDGRRKVQSGTFPLKKQANLNVPKSDSITTDIERKSNTSVAVDSL
jgi:hypothetical protein